MKGVESLAFASIPAFLITLALIPVIGLAIVWVIREIIMQSLGSLEGLIAICVLVGMFIWSIASPNPIIAGATLVTILALASFYPFAQTQLGRQVGHEINADKIDRAHAAISAKPDNAAAWFELAHAIHERGWQGHAIAIAETTLAGLSVSQDPTTMSSTRSLFWSEELALRQWKLHLDPRLAKPLRCPLCGANNPPGPIACCQCRGPYLLELSRQQGSVVKLVGRLVLGWALVGIAIVGAVYLGSLGYGLPGIGAAIVVVGLILLWLFRGARGDATGAWGP